MGCGPGPLSGWKAWEAAGAMLALLAGFHFLALRVRAGGLPGGDEGSWLSVAAELARGHGFTTRWLEGHFLIPYALPRPDDFRYPALTSLLALVFRVAGCSIESARWTVTAVFLAYAASAYLVCRSAFGRFSGMASLWLTVASLLQIEWNSVVYTEGLFGLAVAFLAAWCLHGERAADGARVGVGKDRGLRSLSWWAVLGAGVGVLYLVRANGILFLFGVVWLYWRRRKSRLTWRHPAAAFACFGVVTGPWLIRSARYFGSPFHVAGSAGMLREAGQSHTLSVAQYFSQHQTLFPLLRVATGAVRFFETLHFFEHGLETVPLLLALGALCLRRSFLGPFLGAGFLFTFAASAYIAFDSWAGVRYMSPLLPFVYAYGLSLPCAWISARSGNTVMPPLPLMARAAFRAPAGVLIILLLLLPVLGPHRYYARKFATAPGRPPAYAYRQDLADHLSRLTAHLPAGGRYYAGSLCKVNFLVEDRDCVGLQELYDPTWFPRSLAAFHPSLIVLTHAETKDSLMLAALATMRNGGYTQDTLESGPLAVYLSMRPKAGAQSP